MAHVHAGHHHDHSHDANRAKDRRSLTWAVVITSLFMLVEIIGGVWSQSLSLLSDAGHMFSDVIAQALSLLALYIASRPADARRTYGWYRVEILVALLNGVTLFALAGFIMWFGVQRLFAPVEVHGTVMLVTAAIGLVANVIGAWLLHGSHSLNVRSAYLHIILDGASSVAVLIGAAVMVFTGKLAIIDPALSLIIALFVMYSAYRVVRDAVDVLLEAVPAGLDVKKVTTELGAIDGVKSVHDLHIWTITSGLVALSAHIVTQPSANPKDVLSSAQRLLLDQHAISHTTIQIEGDDYGHYGRVC